MHRQTEGNPLFVHEVLRCLVEEGFVVREGGQWVFAAGTEPGAGISEGLRDVIGKRLSHLSERAKQVLSIAGVMGREVGHGVGSVIAGSAGVRVAWGLLEEDGRVKGTTFLEGESLAASCLPTRPSPLSETKDRPDSWLVH